MLVEGSDSLFWSSSLEVPTGEGTTDGLHAFVGHVTVGGVDQVAHCLRGHVAKLLAVFPLEEMFDQAPTSESTRAGYPKDSGNDT
jgi:hypothetical protein